MSAFLDVLVRSMHRGHCWIKTSDGPRRINDAFDDERLREHLKPGGTAHGLCPIVPGTNVTKVACLDFDSHKGEVSWDNMLRAARQVSAALEFQGLHPHPFRSSGGSGIHLYLLWREWQDAHSVRVVLRDALDACGFTAGTGGVAKDQVEVFPKQDAVPFDGYGSMFILPLGGGTKSVYLGEGGLRELDAVFI